VSEQTTTSLPHWRQPTPTIVESHVARWLMPGEKPYMDVRFYVQAKNESEASKRETLKEFYDLLRCPHCVQRFPFPPCKENLKAWKRELGSEDPGGYMKDIGYRLIADGRCPFCKGEVSRGMFLLKFQGYLDEDTRIIKDAHGVPFL